MSLSGANAGMSLAFGLPLHLTFFGLCALLGLVGSLLLMRRTSIMAGLERDRVLDAAVFALIAAFALSRIMLVASDPRDFVRYPLLVLGLPSLSYTAILLTAIAVALYLRRQRLPLRPVLDAWAPCIAIFFAAVSVGHFLEGTILGMPTTLPWGIYVPRLGRVHPVEIYAAAVATFLCAGLLWVLSRPHAAGQVTRLALVAGGLAAFLLGFLEVPEPASPHAILETPQWVALGAIVAGLVLRPEPFAAAVSTSHPMQPTPPPQEVR